MQSRVVIVGRPNVGKSSLLNRLAGRRVAIVEPTAGVTRDRVTAVVEWGGRRFEAIDTGGLGLVDEALLREHIEVQIEVALQQADVVLFVVDGKDGPVPGDDLVARRLRRLGRPVVLVVNKVESRWEELSVSAWLRLGFGEPRPVSALEGTGISDLLDRAVGLLPPPRDDEDEDEDAADALRFAVVGKRNSGKSTLINRLVGEERVIVSEIPGTTRDAVDVLFEHRGRRMLAIDTAGIRRKQRVQDAIELFAYTRATASIRRAHAVVLMFDVAEEISQVDKKIAAYCVEHAKPVLICGNKIDLADEVRVAKWDAYIRQQLAVIAFAPVAFISAARGDNVDAMLDVLHDLRAQARLEIPTPRLNAVLQAARERLAPRGPGRTPKLFYAVQTGTDPLSILVFVNEPRLFEGQYARYLQNRLRDAFACKEVPLRLVFRRRTKVELRKQSR